MTDQVRTANRVLASIPAKSYTRLQAQLEPVTLEFGQILYEPGKAIRYVKRRKLIDYSRGRIAILDPKRLNASSCSCYQIVKAVFERAQG